MRLRRTRLGGANRQTGGAEHNLIQRPDLLARLRVALGMRQMHVAPALNEGVQPVVIVADVSREPTQAAHLGYYGGNASGSPGGAGPQYSAVALVNEATSGVRARIQSVTVWTNTGTEAVSGYFHTAALTHAALGIRSPTGPMEGNVQLIAANNRDVVTRGGLIDSATFPPGALISLMWAFPFTNAPFVWRPANVIIPPGLGLILQADTILETGVRAQFEFELIPNEPVSPSIR
ncbi:MAG TPA: hypothetical protein VJN39_14840 [Gemmatimonadales bacterium]|nr:hypothetical protein [Gemmatimonadales bacterium]